MRLELAGSLIQPDPLIIKFSADVGSIPHQDFDTQKYIDMGYTHFDVICIGAGGGKGGGIDTANTGTLVRNYGGAGGGGGFHRVRGLLSALPSLALIVVGKAGIPGTNHVSNPALTTNGGDGGPSSFNDPACRASGGKGGIRAQSNDFTTNPGANGGAGGVGNHTGAGGGAVGGTSGIPTPTGPGAPGTHGADGTFSRDIGQGGGGGAGGVGKYGGGTTCVAATNGGRGSYNPADTSVYGPGDTPDNDPNSGSQNIVPGNASGAKASPLNKLPSVYGQSGIDGAIIVRLTAE